MRSIRLLLLVTLALMVGQGDSNNNTGIPVNAEARWADCKQVDGVFCMGLKLNVEKVAYQTEGCIRAKNCDAILIAKMSSSSITWDFWVGKHSAGDFRALQRDYDREEKGHFFKVWFVASPYNPKKLPTLDQAQGMPVLYVQVGADASTTNEAAIWTLAMADDQESSGEKRSSSACGFQVTQAPKAGTLYWHTKFQSTVKVNCEGKDYPYHEDFNKDGHWPGMLMRHFFVVGDSDNPRNDLWVSGWGDRVMMFHFGRSPPAAKVIPGVKRRPELYHWILIAIGVVLGMILFILYLIKGRNAKPPDEASPMPSTVGSTAATSRV